MRHWLVKCVWLKNEVHPGRGVASWGNVVRYECIMLPDELQVDWHGRRMWPSREERGQEAVEAGRRM